MKVIASLLACLALVGCSTKANTAVRLFSSGNTNLELVIEGRRINVAGGTVKVDGKTREIKPTSFDIPDSPGQNYKDESFQLVKPTEDNSLSWQRTPLGVKVCGLAVPNLLVTDSLQIIPMQRPNHQVPLARKEITLDKKWGIIFAAHDTAKASENVLLNYTVRQQRICTIAADRFGKLHLITGKLSRGSPSPPSVQADKLALINVLAPPFDAELEPEDVMLIKPKLTETVYPWTYADVEDSYHSIALKEKKKEKNCLRKTIQKLSEGSPVSICFIGDSVTYGCCASSPSGHFTNLLVEKLKRKYPSSSISWDVFAKGGSNSTTQFKNYLEEYASSNTLKVKVSASGVRNPPSIAVKPDLVIVEFVNDLSLPEEQVARNYSQFVEAMQVQGIETIICLPHLVNPTFYGLKSSDWLTIAQKPYYRVIAELAVQKKFALANVASRTLMAQREGLKPELLLADGANHPNDRGHQIYAEEIMSCLEI